MYGHCFPFYLCSPCFALYSKHFFTTCNFFANSTKKFVLMCICVCVCVPPSFRDNVKKEKAVIIVQFEWIEKAMLRIAFFTILYTRTRLSSSLVSKCARVFARVWFSTGISSYMHMHIRITSRHLLFDCKCWMALPFARFRSKPNGFRPRALFLMFA